MNQALSEASQEVDLNAFSSAKWN